ncbi:hypothetical protein CC78DRAFT_580847 [Lojkania enalia]|uniref:Uncharacterized protein n=1 Tax=Lojkania enalia TaxID=147567 RepID=A0A9P4N618_9PLEO|nr:hypothetical protein CC78DRAFT_580847 [Didymosphaeria enalia]
MDAGTEDYYSQYIEPLSAIFAAEHLGTLMSELSATPDYTVPIGERTGGGVR